MEGRRGGNIMRKKCPTCLSKQAFPAIECSFCRYQFHLYCLGIVSDPPLDIEVFYCSNCERKYNKETKIMTDHLEFLKDVSEEPRRIGSKDFLEKFKKKTFLSADDIPIVRLAGKDANLGYIETHGFETPILVHSSDGLRLKVPNQDFSYKDLLENIGPLKELIVIDVSRQKEEVMYLRELVEYLSRDERPKAINMLSLEFSSTRLNSFVDPPDLVLEMSWISKFWKLDEQNMPQVQKYCLISMAGSYTDFHIDFSGSSVWYHVIRGEKKFYLIKPTSENLEKFKIWMKDETQPYKYFGDCVDHCYEVHIRQGETVFIPSGWIHAVLTPVDSLVFGGNFLNSFNVEMQLRIYDLEEKLATAPKYTFPSFRSVNWQVAYHIRNAALGTNKAVKRYLLENLRSLHPHLLKWSQDVVDPPPQEVNHTELLKEMEIIIGAAWKDDGFGCCTIDSDYMPSPRKKRRRCLNAFVRN